MTDEMVHLVECTTSARKDKASQDVGKLVRLAQELRGQYPMKGIKGYFITRDEPTAEQRDVARRTDGVVVAVSYKQFKSEIIDAVRYLDYRTSFSFGSMQDLDDGGPIRDFHYVESDILAENGDSWRASGIVADILMGKRFILLGDFGAGKSTTCREIFLGLAKRYRSNHASPFGILLNLRNHHGQINPAEALERHARDVGYPHPNHLVRAWLTGSAVILLDGFDEIATAGWTGQAKELSDLRYRSMELVRRFIRETPRGVGMIVSGRSFYFDSDRELRNAFELGEDFRLVSLSDFSEDQVKQYLGQTGWSSAIPSWFPSRPLLLGYLASRRLLDQLGELGQGQSPASGWNELLALICKREAAIEAGIDGKTLCRILESLATTARRGSDGLGPLVWQEIVAAFERICGYSPDERAIVLLQRLPGLGNANQEDGSRHFIDRDLAEAARAGAMYHFVEDPFTSDIGDPASWQTTLNPLGKDIVAHRCRLEGFSENKVATAAKRYSRQEGYDVLCADIIEVAKELGYGLNDEAITVRGVLVQDSVPSPSRQDYSSIHYRDCWFQRLELLPEIEPARLPKFTSCHFGIVEGRVGESDLPEGIFDGCTFDTFEDSAASTAAIMSLSLPLASRVALTVLKKLYLQAGAGRRASALSKGLDHKARTVVGDVLELLRKEGLTIKAPAGDEPVWLPVRAEGARVRRLVTAPIAAKDPLMERTAQL